MVVVGQVRQQVGDPVNQQAQVGRLARFAIHVQRDQAGARVADDGGGHDLGDHGRLFEILAQVPRAALLAGGGLQVAPRHVQTAGVAVHMLQRRLPGDAKARLADHHHQFHLVVIIAGACRIGDGRARGHISVRRLGEIKRRLAVGLHAHFLGMGLIVAAHAKNAAHRILPGDTLDGNGNDRGRGKQVSCHSKTS